MVGGLTTATGLYVGAIAVRRSYDLLSRGLDYLTHRYTTPWIESEPRIAVPSAIATMLLARDPRGSTMLLTHTGVFYLAAPSYDLYEFCAPMANPHKSSKIHIRLSVDAFLLYHSALACLYHQPTYAMLYDELQTRTDAFIADALLHMLCNDFARLLASPKTHPLPPVLSAAIVTLLRTLCDNSNLPPPPRAAPKTPPPPSMWRRLMTYMLGDDASPDDASLLSSGGGGAAEARNHSLDLLRAFFSAPNVLDSFRQALPPNESSSHYYYAPHVDAASTMQRLGVTLRHTKLPQLGLFVQWEPFKTTFEHDNTRHVLVNDVAVRVGRLRYGFASS